MLVREEEIRGFANELVTFREKQQECLKDIKMEIFEEIQEIVDRLRKVHPEILPSR